MRSVSSHGAVRGIVLITAILVASMMFTGCGSSAFSNPARSNAPTATMLAQTAIVPPVLLFNGTGTNSASVSAWQTVLNNNGVHYATANSSEMNGMSEAKLRTYKLLIVPGGNSITIGRYLTRTATANIHNAVQAGLHYLGICAGGFFGGFSTYNGLNLTSGVWFNVYGNYGRGTGRTAVEISYPTGIRLDQWWEDGPQFSGWGNVLGKYPNGAPAVVEGRSGYGWVILCGFHPEAPASWRYGMSFTTSAATDNAYASTLLHAALNGTALQHY